MGRKANKHSANCFVSSILQAIFCLIFFTIMGKIRVIWEISAQPDVMVNVMWSNLNVLFFVQNNISSLLEFDRSSLKKSRK